MRIPSVHTIKFKTSLVVALVVAIIGQLTILLSLGVYTGYKKLQMAEWRSLVGFEAEQINDIIRQLETNARELALIGELYYLDRGRHQAIGRHAVVSNFKINTVAVGGGIWYEPYAIDPEADSVCYYAHSDGKGNIVIDEKFATPEYRYHHQGWYVSISEQLREGKRAVAWSPPYFDEAGTYSFMTTAGAAIYDGNGGLVGISTVDWQLDSIADAVSSLRPTENSFALFADPNNDIVLAMTGEDSDATEKGTPLSAVEWYNPFSEDDMRELSYLGTEYLSFANMLDNGMIFVVNVPRKELFRDIDNAVKRIMAFFTLFGVALATGVYFMLNRFVNRPVAYLSAKATEIGNGNLDAEIRISAADEFAQLADTLGTMTRNIKEHISNLETVTAEKERITTELDIATEIQTSLIPTTFPPFPEREEFDIYASMTPAREVGGDFYDFFMTDDNHVAVVIADVSGKGVPSALFMVVTRTLIRNHAMLKLSPGEVFRLTNEQLCENNKTGMFVTAFMGLLDTRTGIMRCVNAGHNPPLISRANKPGKSGKPSKMGRRFEFLEVKPGFVLGGLENMKYEEMSIELISGDRLFLYTDGVTEAENKERELFGEDRLLDALGDLREPSELSELDEAPEDLKGTLVSVSGALEKYADGTPQSDDVTMLILVFKAGDAENAGGREITLPASLDSLHEAMRFVADTASLVKMPPREMMRLETAVEEIFVNIARYAYGGGEGRILIRVAAEREPDRITVRFQDRGVPYNPLERDFPDTSLPAEEREIGGLGIHMVRNLVDAVEYEYEDGQNILTLTKFFG